MREIPFGQDGSFSFDALVDRYNADLANGYGNLVSRTLAMIKKYFEGVIPLRPVEQYQDSQAGREERARSLSYVIGVRAEASGPFCDRFDFSRALDLAIGGAGMVDRFITASEPWKVAAAGDQDLLAKILYDAAESIRIITLLLFPFIPEAASKVWQQLGLGTFKDGKSEKWLPGEYEQLLQWGGLKPGTRLGELGPIFPRADKDAIKKMQELEEKNSSPKPVQEIAATPVTLNPAGSVQPTTTTAPLPTTTPTTTEVRAAPNVTAAAPAVQPQPLPDAAPKLPEIITIDDFAKIELRVAQIKVAERIPKADKLLRLEVDLGYETRQILSGIAEHYTPESLVGRKIVIIANLAPRKMRGLESNGMLLAASLGEGDKPVLAGFLEDVPLGARLK